MTTNQTIPTDLPAIMPYIIVKDVDIATTFYQKVFGFDLKFSMQGDDGLTSHAEMAYKNYMLMFGKECSKDELHLQSPSISKINCPVSFYVYCDENVDEFYQRVTANGAAALTAPEDMFWGDRMCRVKDLDGYVWAFANHVKK